MSSVNGVNTPSSPYRTRSGSAQPSSNVSSTASNVSPTNYYTSSISRLRDIDTLKKGGSPPLTITPGSSTSLTNNLFAYAQSERSGLSTPQPGLSGGSSRSDSNDNSQNSHQNPTIATNTETTSLSWGQKIPDFGFKLTSGSSGFSTTQSNSDQEIITQNQQQMTSAAAAAAAAAVAAAESTTDENTNEAAQPLLTAYPTTGNNKAHKPRKYACTYPNCNKTFSRRMNLRSHIQSSHEHKKPFRCSVCMMTFARHSDRKRHEKNQHKVTPGFICGGVLKNGQHWGCGKIFKRKDGLMAHWRSQKARRKCLKNVPLSANPLVSGTDSDGPKQISFS